MRWGSAVAAIVILAAVCISYAALSPYTDDPVDDDGGLDGDHGDDDMTDHVILSVGGRDLVVGLAGNETSSALLRMLPMTLTMHELNGNEKYCYLDTALPTDAHRPGTIEAGDVMLFGDDCLVVFYETFDTHYSYTRVGHISDVAGLADVLGDGSVTVTLSETSSADPAERVPGIQG